MKRGMGATKKGKRILHLLNQADKLWNELMVEMDTGNYVPDNMWNTQYAIGDAVLRVEMWTQAEEDE